MVIALLSSQPPSTYCSIIFAVLISICIAPTGSSAQNGGQTVFTLLNTPASARQTALGGENVSQNPQDINQAYFNPATLTMDALYTPAFNYQFFFAGVKQNYLGYGFKPKKTSPLLLHTGLKYVSYGEFQYADEFGKINGTFSGSDLVFTAGGSIPISNRWTFGSNLKFIWSSLESYRASGLGVDLGVHYQFRDSLSWFGLSVRNMGGQLSTYYSGGPREPLPMRIVATITTRLRYVPLRLFLTAQQLERWHLRYQDESTPKTDIFGNPIPEPSAASIFVDNFFRHLVFAAEMSLGKPERLVLRLGYNHFRKKELEIETYRSFAGFSGGVGLNLGKLTLDYGFGSYHLAGSAHHLGLRLPISYFRKKAFDL